MADMNVKNPLSGKQENLFVAMADPVEQTTLHMATADANRLPTFTPFAQGDYFLNASSTAPCANNDLNACLFLPNTAGSTQTFAWNHGGIQPEINNTWIGWVGPGIKNEGGTDKVWTDHTDVRPTILSLLGLKDDYVSDGRVDTEFIKDDALPVSLRGGRAEELGQAWKEINAPFGPFAADTLTASTGALASHTFDDGTYTKTENAIQDLTSERDALAAKIRLALNDAEFNGVKIDEKDAKNWIGLADSLTARAHALADKFKSEPADAKDLQKVNHIVVIYEENHSFDNLYGGWEGVKGLANANAAHTKQINQAGIQFSCLKQNDVNLTSPPLPGTCTDSTTATTFTSNFPNAPFNIDTYIAPTDVTCPKPTVFGPANGLPKNDPAALPGGCTRDLVHRYYQEPYQLNGGNQNRYVTGSDAIGLTMGYYRTKALPIYALPALEEPSRLRDRGQLLPGLVRRLVPEPPVAGGGSVAGLERHPERRVSGRPALRRRCQRDAEQLPAVRLAARRTGEGHAGHAVLQPAGVTATACSPRSRAATTPSTRRSRSTSRSRRGRR